MTSVRQPASPKGQRLSEGGSRATGRPAYTARRMKRIVILISGRGSNMEAIVEACAREGWNARIAAVIVCRQASKPFHGSLRCSRATAVFTVKASGRSDVSSSSHASGTETGAPGRLAEIYAAAKGGVLAFSKSLAQSVAPTVRVNVLSPGWIQTAFADGLPEAARQRIAERTPLRRWGTPDDVARAALFLASADSEFLTGATLRVNGGAVM